MDYSIKTFIAFFILFISPCQVFADDIWLETFSTPEKGYWGGGSDMSGVLKWTIDASACTLDDAEDYIKTVTTSGGRMQAQDIDGEAVWVSETIDVSAYENLVLSVDASETGSSTNTEKYVKVYYKLNGGGETLFETNGENIGNWASATASQSITTASTVQIIVRINNPNAGDRSIFDNVSVTGDLIGNDNDSQLLAGTDVEPANIQSAENDGNSPFQVFDFNFTDVGAPGDGLATIITQIIVNRGPNNEISDWQNVIAGAKLFGPDVSALGLEGTVSASSLTFSGEPLISIANASNETYQLKIWLKTDLSAITDNENLDFSLNYTDISTDATGSSFGSGNETSGAISVSIEASTLVFQSIPDNILTDTDFLLSIDAVDLNGNLDTDFTSQLTLGRNNGTGVLSSVTGLVKNAVGGRQTWADLQYDTQESFDIQAVTTGLAENELVSNTIFAVEASDSIFDDFEDGDLNGWGNTQDWANSTEQALTGASSLKHNVEDLDAQSYIYHNLAALDLDTKTVSWKFNLKNGAWDPSSTSKFWFYLLANENNLNGTSVDGYAVGVNMGGSGDLLTLWKVTDGVVEQALLTSAFNWNSSDMLGVEVRRSTSGEWALFYDDDGGFDDLVSAGSVTNTDYSFTDYCGFVFHIIASRAGQLWIDDINIGQDNYPPEIQSVTAISEHELRLRFSEDMDKTTAENVLNYTINNVIGNPVIAVLNINNPTVIDLSFTNDFISGQNYEIAITAVQDINSNSIADTSVKFSYIPFVIDEVFVINKNELIIGFSRDLDPISAANISNYSVDNSIGNPLTAVLQTETNKVQLNFATDFVESTALSLHVEALENEDDILIDNTDTTFFWYNPQAYDLVFNEIMADPSPVVALPDYEYLELYNKTGYTICLYNWDLIIGDNSKTLPLQNIQSGEYLIICSESAKTALNVYGNTLEILGSSDLTNSGKKIAIRTGLHLTIDTINYSETWYQDENKDNGGWSIERIDPLNTCGQLNNWKASVDISGGTPGSQSSVYEPNVDNEPPLLIGLKQLSANGLELTFNEEFSGAIAADTLNYQLDNTANPTTAILMGAGQNIVQITFTNEFSVGTHSLQISNIHDLCNNLMVSLDTSFTYYPGNEFDIVINEIMLDVSPAPNVLPAAKYIEIYNKTDVNIDLSGWVLEIDDNIEYFEDIKLNAKQYLILTDKSQADLFSNFGESYGIFSKSNLGSAKGQISLFNSNKLLIDYLNFSSGWYGNGDKKSGGWSLERIDAANYCGMGLNWLVSDDYKGGTPGVENSILAENTDMLTFELLDIKILSSAKLSLQFSKNLKEAQALDIDNYSVDNGPGNPLYVSFSDTSRSTIILQFATQFTDAYKHTLNIKNLLDYCDNTIIDTPKEFIYYLIHPKAAYGEAKNIVKLIFSEEVEIVTAQQTENYSVEPDLGSPVKAYKHGTKTNEVYLEFDLEFENTKKYSLNIKNVKDLNGNFIKPAELGFSFFEPAPNDIVLNEILFNPGSGGVDFVEIYNNSANPVDLKHLKIAKRNSEGQIESAQQISEDNSLLLTGNYLAISSDTTQTKNDYPAMSYGQFIQLNSMPSYPDDNGTVVLFFNETIIDEFVYSDDMHLALINDVNGVSLERANPDVNTSSIQNWFSAAESVGFATPANKNSQFTEFSPQTDNEIKIQQEVFSPDNDGYTDRVFINYKFDEPGYVGSLSIYSADGQFVKKIANNELLASEGSFSWDGLYGNNQRAGIGIYIIYFEVFNLQGKVKRFKKTCVVAAKLK